MRFEGFDDYLWGYSDGKTILYNKVTMYSHLQACGIINDHGYVEIHLDKKCVESDLLIKELGIEQ